MNLKHNIDFLTTMPIDLIIVEYNEISTLPIVLNNIFNENIKYIFIKAENDLFHKTKAVNWGINNCETTYAGWHDVDVSFEKQSYLKAYVELCRGVDFIRPFDGKFINLIEYDYKSPKSKWANSEVLHNDSPGGALFFNVQAFKKIGMMDERFISWGFEDDEISMRIKRQSHLQSISGVCYHIDHLRSKNSNSSNPYYKRNYDLFNELRQILKTV